MRGAAELVCTNPLADMDQAAMDRLYDTLNAPYAERVRKQIRAAPTESESTETRVAAVIEVVERLALAPPPVLCALPPIDDDDIHLTCWMAIVSRDASDHRRANRRVPPWRQAVDAKCAPSGTRAV